MIKQTSPTHGFVVVNGRGERIASAENIDDALVLMRVLPVARRVVRARDEAVLAQKGKAYFEQPELRFTSFMPLDIWGQS